MKELKDYSGAFKRGVRYQDFSKEALSRLSISYGKLAYRLDGYWYDLIKEKYGEEVALKLEDEIWADKISPVKVKLVTEAMNIQGKDVESLVKFWQVDPGINAITREGDVEMPSKNHGVVTIKRCASLDYFEKSAYSPEAIRSLCVNSCGHGIERYARIFNPEIKVNFIKMPPRKSKDEIACKYEFKLEESP